MTALLRVVSVQTIDSSPSLLLIAPDGSKTMINCGEGTQRIFLEFGHKLSTVDRVCLTHLDHDSMGGLPGMILTTADVNLHKLVGNAPQNQTNKRKDSIAAVRHKMKQQHRRAIEQDDPSSLPTGLTVVGPTGTKAFIQSLRHFMKRESFPVHIEEGNYQQRTPENRANGGSNGSSNKKKRKHSNTDNQNFFLVQSIVTHDTSNEHFPMKNGRKSTVENDSTKKENTSLKRPRISQESESSSQILEQNQHQSSPIDNIHTVHSRQFLSFIFTTPPIQGKFLADKAKALGIPPGPLYGQLKAGKTITFQNLQNEKITVEPHQVVEPGSPEVVIAILYYPNMEILQQLIESIELIRFQDLQDVQGNDKPALELIVHMTPLKLYHSDSAKQWRKKFGVNVRHLFVRKEASCTEQIPEESQKHMTLSPFQAASVGALMRSKLSSEIYQSPLESKNDEAEEESLKDRNIQQDSLEGQAVPLLEYVIIPRGKRGFQNFDSFVPRWNGLNEAAEDLLQKSGCIEMLASQQQTASQHNIYEFARNDSHNKAEILFTGTGSAIPCRHRNVTGIYVRMQNGNAILLDAGEGTIGQLLRAKHHKESLEYDEDSCGRNVLRTVKAVWISHPHADHHLGLLRLLAEKRELRNTGEMYDPLMLIAPPNLLAFLREYEQVDPRIQNSYIFLNCHALRPNNGFIKNDRILQELKTEVLRRLENELGVSSCTAIPVAHCAHSFAVVLQGAGIGSLAYSGDCRPSLKFAEAAKNADILIHEATFADGLEAEAVVKRHCTIGEAINIAQTMKAKTTLLTHFSQRYPKIPPLPTTRSDHHYGGIIPAFDYMKITPSNLAAAAEMTPILRLLYPDSPSLEEEDEDKELSDAQVALNVPGLFAQNEVL